MVALGKEYNGYMCNVAYIYLLSSILQKINVKHKIYILAIILTCCQTKDNKDVILQFKQAEIEEESIDKFLSEDLTATFSDLEEKMNYDDFISNYQFTQEYEPWNEVVSIRQLNDSTIQAYVLEYSKLLYLFNIDTIGYQYTYILSDGKIKSIYGDKIPHSDFNYQKADSLYSQKLADLMAWMMLHYPDNYEKIEELSSESAQIILKMAEEKYGR